MKVLITNMKTGLELELFGISSEEIKAVKVGQGTDYEDNIVANKSIAFFENRYNHSGEDYHLNYSAPRTVDVKAKVKVM